MSLRPLTRQPELWINGGRFAHDGVRPQMTGAQIRALPFPSIRDTDDLWLAGKRGEQDACVGYDDLIDVDGREFFTAPRFINAG